jgi:cation diffusion facilitator family transporter
MSAGGGTRAIMAALGANLGIAATKFLAFALSGSASMLAESIHSLADSGNQCLLLLGGRRARRGATDEHPFGYGRERYFYAFVVSVVLFSVGGVVALYEGFHKLGQPESIESWQWVPVLVLVIAIGLEWLSLRTAVAEAAQIKGRASWWRFIRHSRIPELPIVLLEDCAALAGLVLALVGVGLTLITADGRWDAAGTLGIGGLLVVVAMLLAIEMKSMLIGESATPEQLRRIEDAVVGAPFLERIIHMRTLHLGPEELLVAMKIGIAREASAVEVANAIDEIESRIRHAVPIARVVYLEPDIYRG